MDTNNERWLPVVGFEGLYSVSDLGRVRSEARTIFKRDGTTQTFRQRILKPTFGGGRGYLLVGLSRDGKARMHRIHSLVMEAHCGTRPDGMVTRHLNGDRFDNRLANLEYGTPSENMYDLVRHGTHWQAKKTHCLRGHEYTEANTYYGNHGRECRTCKASRRKPTAA